MCTPLGGGVTNSCSWLEGGVGPAWRRKAGQGSMSGQLGVCCQVSSAQCQYCSCTALDWGARILYTPALGPTSGAGKLYTAALRPMC
jgi:hypothetical protein